MDVRMKEQVLPPRVKNAKETNLGPKMFGMTRNLSERFSDGAEQPAVEFGLILQNEGVQFVWQREDDVKVTGLK